MSKKIKWLLFGSTLLLVGAALLLIVVYTYSPVVDKAILTTLNSIAGDEVKISYQGISGNLLKQIRIDELLITFDDDSVYCKRVELDYVLVDALKSRFRFDEIAIMEPTVILNSSDRGDEEPHADVAPAAAPFLLPFDKFPDASFDRLIIDNGTLRIRKDASVNSFSDIQLMLAGGLNSDSVNMVLSDGSGYWENREMLLNNASFQIQGNPTRIVLNKIDLRNEHFTVLASGAYQFKPTNEISLDIDSIMVNLEALNAFLPDFPYGRGFTHISGALRGETQDFSGNLSLSGVFDSLRIDQLQAQVHKRDDAIQLTSISMQSNFGNMQGALRVALKGSNNAQLRLQDVNLKQVGLLHQETSISGEIDFDFDNWDFQQLNGRGRISLPGIQYGGMTFDTLELTLAAQQGDFALLPPSRVVFSDQSELFITGSLTRDQYLDVRLSTTDNRLDSLFKQIGMPGFGGRGTLALQLKGPLANPDLSGEIYLDSLTYVDVKIYGVGGQIDVKEILGERSGNFHLNIQSGAINKLKLTRGSLQFSIQKNEVRIDTVTFVSEQNSISLWGNVVVFADSIKVTLDHLGLQYEEYLIQNSQPVQLNIRDDALNISNFELIASDYGSISLQGMWKFSGEFSGLRLEVNNTRLEPVNQFLNYRHQIAGMISAYVNLDGDARNPVLTSSLNVADVQLDEAFMGDIEARIIYQDQALQVERLIYKYADSSYVDVSGTIQLASRDTLLKNLLSPQNPVRLNVEIADINIRNYAFLFNANFPIEGTISGRVSLRGTMGAPVGAMKLTGSDAVVEKYEFPRFEITSRISSTMITIEPSLVNLLDTDIRIRGSKPIHWDLQDLGSFFKDKSFEAICEIEEDSLNFLYAFIPDVDRIIGAIQLSAEFGGDIDRPQLVGGAVDVQNGDLYLTMIENPIQDVRFAAHVRDQRLYIEAFEGRSPRVEIRQSFFRRMLRRWFTPVRRLVSGKTERGGIEATGFIDLARIDRPGFNIDVSLNDAYFHYFLENVRLVVTSDNLHIEGQDTITVSGNVLVREGNVELDIQESEKNLLLSETTRQTAPYLEYLLNVEIADNFFIRSNAAFNTFDIEIGGNVQIIQEPQGFLEMHGELNIIKGKYFIQFEDFDIRSGKIVFMNPKELPELNLTAEKQKSHYRFDLNVTGPLNNPIKEMRTTDLATNEEIYEIKDQMALLIFGVRFEELGGLGQSAFLQKGEEVLAQTLINQFEKEARYFTGLDRIHITTQGSGEPDVDELGGPDEVSTLALGKYLTPNLYLEYQTKLSYVPGLASLPRPSLAWESGNVIYLKYRITQNWSLSSLYEKTLRGNDKVRFDVNWQIDF